MKFRQMLLSITAFALVVGGLVHRSPRARQVLAAASGGDGISSWDNRVMDVGGVLLSALKTQSLENGPVVVFAAVGAMLFLFMVRT